MVTYKKFMVIGQIIIVVFCLALRACNRPNIGRLLLTPTTELVTPVGQNKCFHTEHNEDGEPPRVLITGK